MLAIRETSGQVCSQKVVPENSVSLFMKTLGVFNGVYLDKKNFSGPRNPGYGPASGMWHLETKQTTQI